MSHDITRHQDNQKFCAIATVAFPVLIDGMESEPAQQLLAVLRSGVDFELPGMTCPPPPPLPPPTAFFLHLVPSPATSVAFMSGMRSIMASNGNLPPVSYFKTFQADTPLAHPDPIQPVDFNGMSYMTDVRYA